MSQFTQVTDSFDTINQHLIEIGGTLTASRKDMSDNQFDYLCTHVRTELGVDPTTAMAVFQNNQR